MFDLLDTPARIHSYRDAGYDTTEARRLTKIDMQDAAEDILRKDMVNPVSVEVLELEPIPSNTGVEDIAVDKYETATELDAIIGTCREKGIGMSDIHYRLASTIQNNLLARYTGERVMVTMEAVHGLQYSDRELILHFEDGVGETIKNLWQKVRNSFVNTFNKIKTWYIKAFDATQRLGNKAKAVRTLAEGKQGTVNNNSFEMTGLKVLSMNRRVPDQAAFTNSIGVMSNITKDMLGVSAEHYNKLTENMTDILKGLIAEVEKTIPNEPTKPTGTAPTADGQDVQDPPKPTANQPEADYSFEGGNAMFAKLTENIAALKGNYGKILEPWTEAAQDERFKDNASNPNIPVEFFKSTPLPGDQMIVLSIPKPENVKSAKTLNDMRTAFGGTVEKINAKASEIEDSATFKTLSVSQTQSICDAVMEACKAGLEYKLLFNERDKAFKNLGTQLDQTVNQAEKLQNKALTYVKGNVTAATTIFNKINGIEGKWFRYSMGVFTKAIDYCQGSMNQTT